MAKTTRTNVDIDSDNLEKFKEIYPQHGSIRWFVGKCFEHFVALHTYDAEEVIQEAVEKTLEELEESGDGTASE